MGLWRGIYRRVKGKRGRPRISQETSSPVRRSHYGGRGSRTNHNGRSNSVQVGLHRASVYSSDALVREHMDLPHILWDEKYLTYRDQIVGFCALPKDVQK